MGEREWGEGEGVGGVRERGERDGGSERGGGGVGGVREREERME